MIYLRTIFLPASILIISQVSAQNINPNWKTDLQKAVEEFKKCEQSIDNGVNPCSKYTGEGLNTVYQIKDFYSEQLNRYLNGTEIITFLQTSTTWKKIGIGIIQDVLDEAQLNANANKAVVAVYAPKDVIGHVALILPGELKPSGSWGLNTPNSASFFMNNQQRSYSEKGLSYAFSKSMLGHVFIYVRNY